MKSRIGSALILPALAAFAPAPLQATVELDWFGLDEPPSSSVFRSVGAAEAPGTPASPVATTEWPVEINMDLLAALPDWLDLNLPDRGIPRSREIAEKFEARVRLSGQVTVTAAAPSSRRTRIASWARCRVRTEATGFRWRPLVHA